ncbi:hypothetical protein GCM10011395_05450 [Sphingomonas psychrolutea]|uniref:Response regulatory domain-containing protein n=1 Tax=Sphingomonas psychrolutea TaxID=1259676 RepID=A0ABQ1G728_9SPHN|nr:hypothetical protein GCM10011395_05450 [Sphingomonas psychrolutea]
MCHVLIIEDEPLIALDLEDLLKRNGAHSFSFANSQQAAIDESRINPHPQDFILSDVVLTEGTGSLAVEVVRSELWREIKPEVKDCVAPCAKGGAGAVNFGRAKDANLTLPGGGAHICAC